MKWEKKKEEKKRKGKRRKGREGEGREREGRAMNGKGGDEEDTINWHWRSVYPRIELGVDESKTAALILHDDIDAIEEKNDLRITV